MNFAQQVDAALGAARAASEFTLSRAEECAALEPVVATLRAMPRQEAEAFIRASFRGAGSPETIALSMFKRPL